PTQVRDGDVVVPGVERGILAGNAIGQDHPGELPHSLCPSRNRRGVHPFEQPFARLDELEEVAQLWHLDIAATEETGDVAAGPHGPVATLELALQRGPR